MGVCLVLLKDACKEESLGCVNGRVCGLKTEENDLCGFANCMVWRGDNGEKIMLSGIKVSLQRW